MLTNKTKDLMHKTIDGNIRLIIIMHHLSHYRYCDDILSWLLRAGLKGKALEGWLTDNFKNSVLSMVKYIVKKINMSNDTKPVYLGKDWLK
jgi:hypothetical protein